MNAPLPHAGNARFVREVLEVGGDGLVCVGRIPAGSPFARNGRVPGFVLVELAAQAAATDVLAKTAYGDREPRAGYVVRARGMEWTAGHVPADTALVARVRRDESMPPLYVYRVTITLEGSEVLSGAIGIYVDGEAA